MNRLSVDVRGLTKVLDNLNSKIDAIPFKLKKGLIKAGLLIQREAQKIVPVDTGNLRASAFVAWDTGGRGISPSFSDDNRDRAKLRMQHADAIQEAQHEAKTAEPTVVVGFSAHYAIIQHENYPIKRNPEKEWKYLESAIKRNESRILDEIRSTVK